MSGRPLARSFTTRHRPEIGNEDPDTPAFTVARKGLLWKGFRGDGKIYVSASFCCVARDFQPALLEQRILIQLRSEQPPLGRRTIPGEDRCLDVGIIGMFGVPGFHDLTPLGRGAPLGREHGELQVLLS